MNRIELVGKYELPQRLREFARFDARRRAPRLKNPSVGGIQNVIDDCLIDSVSFGAGTAFTKTTLFQQPIGAGGKTLAQTTMRAAGRLDNNDRFRVYSIEVYISNTTIMPDVQAIVQQVSLSFQLQNKPFIEGPVLRFPAAVGAFVSAAAQLGTAAAGNIPLACTSNGSGNSDTIYKLANPIDIGINEGFAVILNPETAFNLTAAAATNPPGVGTTLYVFLSGERFRGVN
jgi:hypothetical protein